MKNIIIQGIGFLGLLAFIASYQIKSNKKLFLIHIVGIANEGLTMISIIVSIFRFGWNNLSGDLKN